MPWINEKVSKTDETPERYVLPRPLEDEIILGSEFVLHIAKSLRRVAAQEKDKPDEKEHMRWWAKRYKGYDYAVKYYEISPEYVGWRTPRANKELAPYIDAAFIEISLARFPLAIPS